MWNWRSPTESVLMALSFQEKYENELVQIGLKLENCTGYFKWALAKAARWWLHRIVLLEICDISQHSSLVIFECCTIEEAQRLLQPVIFYFWTSSKNHKNRKAEMLCTCSNTRMKVQTVALCFQSCVFWKCKEHQEFSKFSTIFRLFSENILG